MSRQRVGLSDLDQPVTELTPEQAAEVRGGLFTAGIISPDLPAVQDTAASSGKVQVHDLNVVKVSDKASP